MSRIPMVIASTLVVLAALGMAHLLVFRGSTAHVEAAPPESASAAPATGYVAPVSAKPDPKLNQLRQRYGEARARIESQTRDTHPQTVTAGHLADENTKVFQAVVAFDEVAEKPQGKTGVAPASCGSGCFELTFGGDCCPLTLKVFRGIFVEDACGCEEGECRISKPSRAATARRVTAAAKKIEDFAAADQHPLGRLVAGFGTWFQMGECQDCPLCVVGEACPGCKDGDCDCPKVAVKKSSPAVVAAGGIGKGVKAVSVAGDNCPGAEGEGRPVDRTSKEESRDRALAEQIGQIEEIRRERRNPLLQGTLLEGSDENEANEFNEALRLVAGFSQLVEGDNPPPGALPPNHEGGLGPNFAPPESGPAAPGAPDPLLVDVLRQASRLLDLRSHDLEDIGRYEDADHLRGLAQAIRHEARKAGPSGSEGGCGLFCPANAAKAMCSPSTERATARRAPLLKEGPVSRQ